MTRTTTSDSTTATTPGITTSDSISTTTTGAPTSVSTTGAQGTREEITAEASKMAGEVSTRKDTLADILAGMSSSDPNYQKLENVQTFLGTLVGTLETISNLDHLRRRKRLSEDDCTWKKTVKAHFEEEL